jgi:hypothetical protein
LQAAIRTGRFPSTGQNIIPWANMLGSTGEGGAYPQISWNILCKEKNLNICSHKTSSTLSHPRSLSTRFHISDPHLVGYRVSKLIPEIRPICLLSVMYNNLIYSLLRIPQKTIRNIH